MSANKSQSMQSPEQASKQLDINIQEVLNSIKSKTKLIIDENQKLKLTNNDLSTKQSILEAQFHKLKLKMQELTQKKDLIYTEIKQLEEQQLQHYKAQSDAIMLEENLNEQYNILASQYAQCLANLEELEKAKQIQRQDNSSKANQEMAQAQNKLDSLSKSYEQLNSKHIELQKAIDSRVKAEHSRKKHLMNEDDKIASIYHKVSFKSNI